MAGKLMIAKAYIKPLTDIVIPYYNPRGSDELKYCLRGVEQFLPNRGNVFIIGELPEWITEVMHIPFTDQKSSKFKERNIYNKIIEACNCAGVSGDFLFMNDDHFLLDSYPNFFPFYYSSMHEGNEVYRNQVKNTPVPVDKYFDIHCPILFNKDRFRRAFDDIDWSVAYGYLIKTIYCFNNGITGELMADCKLRVSGEQVPNGRRWFSTSDKAYDKAMLEKIYPNKSMYEKSS